MDALHGVMDGVYVHISRWINKKLKAQLCVHGDKLVHGVDFFKSYAPVVQWTTIHLILILAIVLNCIAVQTDYTNAYAQATLTEELHVDTLGFYCSRCG